MNVLVNRCGLKSVLWHLIYSPNKTRFQTLLKILLLRMKHMTVYQDHDNYNFRRYLTGFYYIIILLSCEHFYITWLHGIDLAIRKTWRKKHCFKQHLDNFLLRKYLCPFVNRTKVADHKILLVRFFRRQRHFHILV